jgi:hypothetical protein
MLKRGERQDNVPDRNCSAQDVTVVNRTHRAEFSPSASCLQRQQAFPPAMDTINKTRHPASTPATNQPPAHSLLPLASPPLQLLCRGKMARRYRHHHLGATSASLRKASLPGHHGVAVTPHTGHPGRDTTPPLKKGVAEQRSLPGRREEESSHIWPATARPAGSCCRPHCQMWLRQPRPEHCALRGPGPMNSPSRAISTVAASTSAHVRLGATSSPMPAHSWRFHAYAPACRHPRSAQRLGAASRHAHQRIQMRGHWIRSRRRRIRPPMLAPPRAICSDCRGSRAHLDASEKRAAPPPPSLRYLCA